MRIRGTKRKPLIDVKSTRTRIFRLGLALVLVFVAIRLAADPATWAFFFSPKSGPAPDEPTLSDVSYTVHLDDEDGLEPDEFRAVPDPGERGAPNPSQTPSPPSLEDGGQRSENGKRKPDPDDLIIPPAQLADVEDNTLGLKQTERDAYFAILSELRDRSNEELPPPDPSATFPIVMVETEHFRGRMIELEGSARRILEIPAGENDAGFETLYELWVFTPESGNNPWRVVATELPASLSKRGVVEEGEPVRLVGVFFKREGYETQNHDLHVAPLVLAKSVERSRRPSSQFAAFDPVPWVFGTLFVAGGGLAWLLWRFRREDKAFEQRVKRLATDPGKDADDTTPALPPDEFLKQLEADSQNSDV